MWDSLEQMGSVLLRATRKTRSPSLEADVHKILLLRMLGFCGVVVLIAPKFLRHVVKCASKLVPRHPCRVQCLMKSR